MKAILFLVACAVARGHSSPSKRKGRQIGKAVNAGIGFEAVRAIGACVGIRSHPRARPTFPALRLASFAVYHLVSVSRLAVVQKSETSAAEILVGIGEETRWWVTFQFGPEPIEKNDKDDGDGGGNERNVTSVDIDGEEVDERQRTRDPSPAPTTISPTAHPSNVSVAPSMIPTTTSTLSTEEQPTTRSPSTTRPILSPSSSPPTMRPAMIVNPTEMPTTSLPTSTRPATEPTPLPSHMPTFRPIVRPSLAPVSEPTFKPTDSPSNSPSPRPTYTPTRRPSHPPSPQPSYSPTDRPSTSHPSYQPTTTSPTTVKPTTSSPTYVPTTFPPSFRPTRAAPRTPEPTYRPTRRVETPRPTNDREQEEEYDGDYFIRYDGDAYLAEEYWLQQFNDDAWDRSTIIIISYGAQGLAYEYYEKYSSTADFEECLSFRSAHPTLLGKISGLEFNENGELVQFSFDLSDIYCSEPEESADLVANRRRLQSRTSSSSTGLSERRENCVRRAARAITMWAYIILVLVCCQLVIAPLVKACVVAVVRRRTSQREEEDEDSAESATVKSTGTKQCSRPASVRAMALETSDDPLLWPRIAWPVFPFALCAVALAAADPAWSRKECWNWPPLGAILVVALVALYVVSLLVHVVFRLRGHDAVYIARTAHDQRAHSKRLPKSFFQPSEAIWSVRRSLFNDHDLFQEYALGEWRDNGDRFVSSHGAAFEDYTPRYANVAEAIFVFLELLSGVAIGLGAFFSSRAQLIALLVLRVLCVAFTRGARPFANIALNFVVFLEHFFQLIAMVAIAVAHFQNKDYFVVYWIALVCHFAVLFVVLLLPVFVDGLRLLRAVWVRCCCFADREAYSAYRSKSSRMVGEFAFAVTLIDALAEACRDRPDCGSFCSTWTILVRREIVDFALWCVGVSRFEKESPSQNNQIPPQQNIHESDDDEEEEDRFQAMSVSELKAFIRLHGGNFKDCIDRESLVDRAREVAQNADDSCMIQTAELVHPM